MAFNLADKDQVLSLGSVTAIRENSGNPTLQMLLNRSTTPIALKYEHSILPTIDEHSHDIFFFSALISCSPVIC